MIFLPFRGYGTLTPVKYKLKRKIIWGYRPVTLTLFFIGEVTLVHNVL
jgi:hypothetical protein